MHLLFTPYYLNVLKKNAQFMHHHMDDFLWNLQVFIYFLCVCLALWCTNIKSQQQFKANRNRDPVCIVVKNT